MEAKHIFLAGIGGIGVSGLARILKAGGKTVAGSDVSDSELITALKTEGIDVKIGHKKTNLSKNTELLIYSAAVPENNPERLAAKELDLPELSYAEAVGKLTDDYFLIAVAGTNGKTTTAAMLTYILEKGGLDPTALVGSVMKQTGSNVRVGESKYFVLEADEYRRGFLHYQPNIAVLTNIAADHLDYFQDETDVKRAFFEFTQQIKADGSLIYNAGDKNTKEVADQFTGSKVGFHEKKFELKVPGSAYQKNASAAAATAAVLGIEQSTIKTALKNFPGSWRRFEKVGWFQGADIISDYAHHPAGVEALLETATKLYPKNKVLVVYQPHQHNRTKKLFDDFIKSFCQSVLSDFIMVEIFDVAGREEDKDQDISSKKLTEKLIECGKNAVYTKNLKETEAVVRDRAGEYDAVLIVGAGDIYLVAKNLMKEVSYSGK